MRQRLHHPHVVYKRFVTYQDKAMHLKHFSALKYLLMMYLATLYSNCPSKGTNLGSFGFCLFWLTSSALDHSATVPQSYLFPSKFSLQSFYRFDFQGQATSAKYQVKKGSNFSVESLQRCLSTSTSNVERRSSLATCLRYCRENRTLSQQNICKF